MEVAITGAARAVLEKVKGEREDLVFVFGDGCCEGTAPLLFDHYLVDAEQIRVGVLEGVPEGRVRVYAWVMPPGAMQVSANAQAEVVVTPGDDVEAVLRLAPLK